MIRKTVIVVNLLVFIFNYSKAQVVTASQTDSLVGDHQTIGIANPNDTVRYKTTISVSGANASGVNFNNAIPTNTTQVGTVKTSALCRDDVFATSFNTLLNTGNVLSNDYGLPSVNVVSFGTTMSGGTTTMAGNVGTTNGGGSLTLNANGTFSYQPMMGFSGMDQFTYIGTTGVAGLQNGSATVTINVATDITFTTMDSNPDCNGAFSGSIVFNASGGTGALTYSITGAMGPFQMSPTFSGLPAGMYNLAVKDAVGYIKTGTTTLTDPTLITFTTMDVDNICNGGMIGSITFNASGGTGALTYSITGSMGIYQAGTTFSGLGANTYNLAVKDANNCIVTGTTTITEPTAVTFTFTKTDISCFGAGDGSIVFNTTMGGTSPYTYSINGTMGSFTGTTNYNGLSAAMYNLVAKDNLGCNSAVQTTTVVEPAVIVVSGNIPTLTYNTAMSNANFSKTGGTGSPMTPWSASGFPTGVSINTSTGVVSGTPTQTGMFSATITYTDVNGCTDDHTVNFNVIPKLIDNLFTFFGNTQLVSNGHSTPTTPHFDDTENILTNDMADAPISITAGTFTTLNGGSININANGKFSYFPAVGSENDDEFTYTGTVNGVSATAKINFGFINAAEMMWYVDNTFTGTSDGRSHAPFKTLNAAQSPSTFNNIIYVHTGSGNTTGNFTFKNGQQLIGAGSSLNNSGFTIPAGVKPTLSGTLTFANSITANGFDMNTGTSTALSSSGATSVNVSIGNVTTSGPTNAVSLTNTTGSISIAGGTLTGGAGTLFNVSGGSATINCAAALNQSTASQRLVNISSISGGTITFSGNLSSTGTSTGINVTSCTGGTINFSGSTKTLNTSSNSAVTLATNTGATINFTNGGLDIDVTSGTGFNATGGGTINVTGTGNSVTSTTGTALNVANTTIGANNLNFQSVAANGATNGIVLNNTGTSGGLKVTGTASAGSGGTIQNCTTFGISLATTRLHELNYMIIQNSGDDGIYGENVNSLTLTNCQILNNGNAVNTDCGIDMGGSGILSPVGSAGTITISNSTITGNYSNQIFIGQSSGTTNLSLTGCTITGSTNNDNNDGILLSPQGTSTINSTISSSNFSANKGDHIQMAGTNSAGGNIVINGNTFTGGHPTALGQGITINAALGITFGGYTGSITYDIDGNNFNGAVSNAIIVNLGTSAASASFDGYIRNNTIGTAGVPLSGSSQANGIGIDAHGLGQHTCSMTNNIIRRCFDYGIFVLVNDGGTQSPLVRGQLNLTCTGNTVTDMADTNGMTGTPREAFHMNAGATSTNVNGGIDNHAICLHLSGNSLTGGANKNGDIRLRQRFQTSVSLPGYTPPGGNNFDTASVITFVQGNNTGSIVTATTNNDGTVTYDGYYGGPACQLP